MYLQNTIMFIYDNINEKHVSNVQSISFLHPKDTDSKAVSLIKGNGIFVVGKYIQSDLLIRPYVFIKPIQQLCSDAFSSMRSVHVQLPHIVVFAIISV